MVPRAKNLFFSLLLVTFFIFDSEGQEESSSREENKKSQCNHEEYFRIIESSRGHHAFTFYSTKVTYLLSEFDYAPLTDPEVILIQVPEQSKSDEDDIRRSYRQVYSPTFYKYMRVIIHAGSIDKVAEIFRDLTIIFRDLSAFHEGISIVLSLNDTSRSYDEVSIKMGMISRLENFANDSKREDADRFVKSLSTHRNERIIILNNEPFSEPTLGDLNFLHIGWDNFRSLIGHYILDSIKCSIAELKETILSDRNKVVRIFFDITPRNNDKKKLYFRPEAAETIEDSRAEKYNYVWHLMREFSNTTKSEDLMRMMQNAFIKSGSYVRDDPLRSDVACQILFYVSEKEFRKTAEAWFQQFKEFDIKIPRNLTRWYEEREGGILLKREKIRCGENRYDSSFELENGTIILSQIDFHRCLRRKGGKMKNIKIFAYEKVVIDVDLIYIGDETHVTIIAPIWEIVGNRTINLSGVNGENPGEPQARNGSVHEQRRVDEHVAQSSTDGMNGKDGSPGGHAGTFFGIAGTIISAQNLTILANGGNGSSGQNGGHGVEDTSIKTYNGVPKFDCVTGRMTEKSDWEFIDAGKNCINSSHEGSGENLRKCYIIRGKKAGPGGKGGNGGKGGEGGEGGYIVVHELSRQDPLNSLIRFSAENGRSGVGGNGGNPGAGAKNGKDVKIQCLRDSGNNGIVLTGSGSEDTKLTEEGSAGEPGGMKRTKEQRPWDDIPWLMEIHLLAVRSRLMELGPNHSEILSEFHHSLIQWKERSKWDVEFYTVLFFTLVEQRDRHRSYNEDATENHENTRAVMKYLAGNLPLETNSEESVHLSRLLYQDISERIREMKTFEKHPMTIDFGTLIQSLFGMVPHRKYSNFIIQKRVGHTMNDKALRRALKRLETALMQARIKLAFRKYTHGREFVTSKSFEAVCLHILKIAPEEIRDDLKRYFSIFSE